MFNEKGIHGLLRQWRSQCMLLTSNRIDVACGTVQCTFLFWIWIMFIFIFITIKMNLQSILFLSFIQGDLLVPDEGRQGFVQEVHLPHEDVGGLRSLRYLLHEVQIRLCSPETMEVRWDRRRTEQKLSFNLLLAPSHLCCMIGCFWFRFASIACNQAVKKKAQRMSS